MPPIRRYLRISKHSALECRIFLENPADGPRWLLNPANPALPRIFEAVKPLVLPKLKEENEKAKGKGKKKRSVKDVIVKDDFEVSVFLAPVGTRHHLVVKNRVFEAKPSLIGNNTKTEPVILREDSDDDTDLANIPVEAEDQQTPDAQMDEAMLDDKKSLAFKTTYSGFAIWGKVLCLLVERKTGPNKKIGGDGGAQALMQEWITASQMQIDDDE